MRLYRPVGANELNLIAQADYCAFPPRLPEQPIFYPVLNFEHAEQIAREWNTKSHSFAGFVTKFEVEDEYIKQFEVQVVGSRVYQELWVPAAELRSSTAILSPTLKLWQSTMASNLRAQLILKQIFQRVFE